MLHDRTELLLVVLRLFRHVLRGLHFCLIAAVAVIVLAGVGSMLSIRSNGVSLSMVALAVMSVCLMTEKRLVRARARTLSTEAQLWRAAAWLTGALFGVLLHITALIVVLFGLSPSLGLLGLMTAATILAWIASEESRHFRRLQSVAPFAGTSEGEAPPEAWV